VILVGGNPAGAPGGGEAVQIAVARAFLMERVQHLERQLECARALVDDHLESHNHAVAQAFRDRLDNLHADLNARVSQCEGSLTDQWAEFNDLHEHCRRVFADELEVVGGLGVSRENQSRGGAFGDGRTELAQDWLDGLRRVTQVEDPLVLIAGGGAEPRLQNGIVHLPGIEWDLWHLPLLGRTLASVIVAQLGEPDRPLFADVLATCLLGPAYAFAVLVIDFDYSAGSTAWIDRLGAIAATLRRMDDFQPRPPYEDGPFTTALERLKALAQQLGVSLAPLHTAPHESLYARASTRLGPPYAEHLRTDWRWARDRAGNDALDGLDAQLSAMEVPRRLTALLNLLWWLRLQAPGLVPAVLERAHRFLDLKRPTASTRSLPPLSLPAATRLEYLYDDVERLHQLLDHPRISREVRSAISGRVFRRLSEQLHGVGSLERDVRAHTAPTVMWREMAERERNARTIEREVLELLANVVTRERRVDAAPASPEEGPDSPSVCALADALLRSLAEQTGQQWNAAVVLGTDPLLEWESEIVKVQFPDWGLWSLPLLGHEFGHLVARGTPELQRFRVQQIGRFGRPEPLSDEDAVALEQQLDELFADVFALYTLGPAFACAAMLLHFNPHEAALRRGNHPTHAQRVATILEAIERANAATREGPTDRGRFALLIEDLQQRWQCSIEALSTSPVGQGSPWADLEIAKVWGQELFGIVDGSFRLGARYTPERWKWARDRVEALRVALNRGDDMHRSTHLVTEDERWPETKLEDLLNLIWWARLSRLGSPTELDRLALRLGSTWLDGRQP
jgi:hypothetical protein